MTFASFDPTNDEDGLPIVIKEPRQSWKANLFWGSLGLIAAVTPWFEPDADWFDRIVYTFLGSAWAIFMGMNAWRNFGRTVRCDMETISVSQAFKSFSFPLAQVASITREDSLAQLREFENIGVSKLDQARRLDTRAPVIMYVLRDAQGHTLLRVDKDMEPAEAMGRFIRRCERQARSLKEARERERAVA